MAVERERIRALNSAPLRKDSAQYVIYWAQMNRRVESNHGLLHAIEIADRLGLPVLYYEGLTCSYPHANLRLHTFILEGVPDTECRLKKLGIGYVFSLRRRTADRNDTLYRLAKHAAAVVTDDYPTFIARTHNTRVPAKLDIPYIAVDSSCIVPMSVMAKREYAAYTIRPKIHRELKTYLKAAGPIRPKHKWPASHQPEMQAMHTTVERGAIPQLAASCEIDHSIKPSPTFTGGRDAAEKRLQYFLKHNLHRYAKGRNEPSEQATSRMSPYLHFGHISPLEIALAVEEHAAQHNLNAAEYLEELIVRRELAFNYARFVDNPQSLGNLPEWCQKVMEKHSKDKRDPEYSPEQLERAETHDELWNATQKEMLHRGIIHGYYRMYWGKKILEWSPTFQGAVDTMVEIHEKYALDGRDPNTFTNILWCFGLHDRPWFERPVFGALRYMSLDGMKRKTNTRAYIDEIRYLETTGKDPAANYRPQA